MRGNFLGKDPVKTLVGPLQGDETQDIPFQIGVSEGVN